MTVPGYIPASEERDPQKLARSIRNLFEAFTAVPLTEDASPDTANDWLFLVDVSAGVLKKVHPDTIGGGGDAATESAAGIVELATDAEARTDTDSVVLTPGNLANRARFRAHKNGTTQTGVADATLTKVTFSTENFDVGSYFDTTNSRWTPPANVPVFLFGEIAFTGANMADGGYVDCAIYKNGSIFQLGSSDIIGAVIGSTGLVCAIDVPDGDDYYEVYGRASGTAGNKTIAGLGYQTSFSGFQL